MNEQQLKGVGVFERNVFRGIYGLIKIIYGGSGITANIMKCLRSQRPPRWSSGQRV